MTLGGITALGRSYNSAEGAVTLLSRFFQHCHQAFISVISTSRSVADYLEISNGALPLMYLLRLFHRRCLARGGTPHIRNSEGIPTKSLAACGYYKIA